MSEEKARRKALEEIRGRAFKNNEGSRGLLDRLLGELDRDALKYEPDTIVKDIQRNLGDMSGHMVLDRNLGLDPDKFGDIRKLILSEYPSLEELQTILDPNDPDYAKKHSRLSEKLSKGDLGHTIAQIGDDGLYSPRDIVIKNNGLTGLQKASTALHEGQHAVDYGMGYGSVPIKDATEDMFNSSRSLVDVANKQSKGHHNLPMDYDVFSIKKAMGELKGNVDDKTVREAIRRGAGSIGKKLGAAIPLVGPLLGAGMALNNNDASAAIPGLDMADNVGMSSEDENMMLSEEGAKVDYGKSRAKTDRLKALRALKLNK